MKPDRRQVDALVTFLGIGDRDPSIIFTKRRKIIFPRMDLDKLTDNLFGPPELAGPFSRLGRAGKLWRWLGNALGVKWLYNLGMFYVSAPPPMFVNEEIALGEVALPGGGTLVAGYSGRLNVLAIQELEDRPC